MSKIDLHIHSNISDDGELSPEEIMAGCLAKGMELVAVTDHNSVRGVAAARAAAGPMRLLSGVELDCTLEGRNFHLLGYDFDDTCREFDAVERDIRRQEKEAAELKIHLFTKATGIPLDVSEVMEAATGGVVTGELIAQLLLAREDAGDLGLLAPYLPGGDKSDMPNVRFYWDFFSEGKAAYVPIRYLTLGDAAELIHGAGGIAVLAHPGQNLSLEENGLLEKILSQGIDGMEVFSSYHSQKTAAHYLAAAQKNNLLVTCGSDFHGRHKPGIRIGGHGAFLHDEELKAGLRASVYHAVASHFFAKI